MSKKLATKNVFQEELSDFLNYNPSTGICTFQKDIGIVKKKGDVAGTVDKKTGYRFVTINGKKFKTDKLAFLLMLGYLPNQCVKHIDNNKNNDKWLNLIEKENYIDTLKNAKKVKNIIYDNWKKQWCMQLKYGDIKGFRFLGLAALARLNFEEKNNIVNEDKNSAALYFRFEV